MTLPEINSLAPKLRLDGELNHALDETLLSLEVEESLDAAAHCQARFVNVGSSPGGSTVYLYFDRSILDFGKVITVEIGFGQAATNIFDGWISALEASYPPGTPPEFLILAEDSLHKMCLPHRTRLFYDLTIPEIIGNVASEYGLDVQADLLSSYPQHAALAQFEQSDLSFLYDCAHRSGIDLWVRQGSLVMRDNRAAGDEIQLTYGEKLRSFSVRADLAEQITSLSVTGWDSQGKQVVGASVGDDVIQDELDGWRSGSHYLLEAFNERNERLPASLPSSTAEATALSGAAFRQRAQRFVTGVALVEGDARLRLGGRVHLDGVGEMFSGPYYIEKVRHHFDRKSGYRTELHVSRLGLERNHRARLAIAKKKGQVQKRPSKAAASAKIPTGRKL